MFLMEGCMFMDLGDYDVETEGRLLVEEADGKLVMKANGLVRWCEGN